MHDFGITFMRFAEAFQQGLAKACLALLGALAVACFACFASKQLRGTVGPWLRQSWRSSKIVTLFLCAAFCQVFYVGATKGINYRADEGIGLVAWEQENFYDAPYVDHYDDETGAPVMASNVVSFAWNFATTNNVRPTPISFRETNTNTWTSLMAACPSGWSNAEPVWDHAEGGTNWWRLAQSDFATFTNLTQAAKQWYVGNDLPAVDVIMGDLVVLTRVVATSSSFHLYWEYDPNVDLANKTVTRADGTSFAYRSLDIIVTISGYGVATQTVTLEDVGPSSASDLAVEGFMVDSLRRVQVEAVFNEISAGGN